MDKYELYYDYAKLTKEEQESSRRHFDMMATAMLAIAGALIGAVAFGSFKHHFIERPHYLFIGALICFAACAISAIAALWLRKWKINPLLNDLQTYTMSEEYTDNELLLWSAKQISDVEPDNAKVLNSKAKWLRICYISFALEAVILGILIITI